MLKKLLKTEIEIVHLTSDDKKFIYEEDALQHEWLLNQKKEIIREDEQMIDEKIKTVIDVLSRNEWGIFFKGEPLTSLPVQDGIKVYKVNEVNQETFSRELRKNLETKEKEWQKHQTSQNQTSQELSSGTRTTLNDIKE
jgi:hypothetical protein